MPITACASGVSYPGLAQGNRAFKVRATDAAGNVGPFASYGWTIDLAAPQLDITAGPPAAINQQSATFSFTSPAPGAAYTCKLDRPGHAGTFVACFGSKTYPDLVESAYTFSVKATTPAGNTSTASRGFTVDRTAPSGTFPALAPVSHGIVQFAAKPTDGGAPATGVASVTYSYTGPASGTIGASNRAPWTIGWNTAGLPDGAYTVRAVPTDAAGNAGTIPTVLTRLDNSGPDRLARCAADRPRVGAPSRPRCRTRRRSCTSASAPATRPASSPRSSPTQSGVDLGAVPVSIAGSPAGPWSTAPTPCRPWPATPWATSARRRRSR